MCAAKTVITESFSVVDEVRGTATVHCSAVTDPLTPQTVLWITTGDNASDTCATWRLVDEARQQVRVELDDKHVCCTVVCSASNGLSEDSRSASICWMKDNSTLSPGYRQSKRQFLVARPLVL